MADAKKMKCGGRNGKEQKNENIQVFVRVRPQNAQEKLEKCGKSATVIECNKDREIIVKERSNSTLTKTFTFDRVFAPDSKQIDVYKTVVNPLIDEVLAGYNCTVFAYGQTGTGKTFTMEGERSSADSTWEKDPQCGIVPRVLSHIFDELRMQQLEFTMSVSYLELYNEELIDLLSPIDDTTKLRLFEDAAQKGSLVIQGLQEILVLDKKEVYEIMNKGSQKRQTAATLMNAHSSRSHTIFTVTVHIRESTDDGEELLRTGKINLVDLAGSENIGRSGAKQQRAREAGNINQSLLTLGRVITALVERTPHVPYRESKLTRLLQDSLGGRTKTSIIATVSPVLANLEETLSTLDYAHRAKSITNRPEINQRLTKKALLKEYTTEIERLRRDLEATRDGTGVYVAHENYVHMTQRIEKQDVEISENIQRIRALEEERDKKEAICDRLHMELEEKSQLLEQTTKTLEGTRDILLNTQEQLQNTEEDRDEKAVLLENHMATEEVLTTQATTLLAVADQSTTDLQRVHDKLDYKRSLEEQNFQAVQEFKDAFRQKLARMNENIASYTEEHSQQIGDVRSKLDEALQSTRQIDSKAHKEVSSFIESHGNSLQALEMELRQQAESRQQWSHAQLQSTRDTSESQLAAMHAALTESYARNNALMHEVETIKGNTAKSLKAISKKVDAQEKILHQFIQSQVESVSGMHRLTMDFSQKMISELQRSKDQIALLGEHRETTHKRDSDNIAQLMQLLQNWNTMHTSSREEEKTILEKVLEAEQEQSSVIADHTVKVETQLNDIDSQANSLQRAHEESSAELSKNIRECGEVVSSGLDSVLGAQKAVMADVQALERMVEQGWKQHAANVEEDMRSYAESGQADLESLGIHTQDLRTKVLQEAEQQSNFREARQKSLTDFLHAAGVQLSEQVSATHSWSTQHNHELFERSQEVSEFLNNGIKQDQPTGNTPQRRVMEFPRTLKATSPHERILQRMRDGQLQRRMQPMKCPSLESVSVLSSGDENVLMRSTSTTSLSSSSSNSEERNKENGIKDLIVNTASPKLLNNPSKNLQDANNKTKRKVLANQN